MKNSTVLGNKGRMNERASSRKTARFLETREGNDRDCQVAIPNATHARIKANGAASVPLFHTGSRVLCCVVVAPNVWFQFLVQMVVV